MEELQSDIKQLMEDVKEVKMNCREIQSIKTDMTKMGEKIDGLYDRYKQLTKSHNATVEEVALLGDEHREINRRRVQLEQYMRADDVIIAGIPALQNENGSETVEWRKNWMYSSERMISPQLVDYHRTETKRTS